LHDTRDARLPENEGHARSARHRLLQLLEGDQRGQLLRITEHHDAVDDVPSLINLALGTGHVRRWGSGLIPLRGQNNVQGGGDMGALGAGRFLRRPACT
jgi:hypothetical protein